MNRRGFITALIGAAVAPLLPSSKTAWRLYYHDGQVLFPVYSPSGNITSHVALFFTNGVSQVAQIFDGNRLLAVGGMQAFTEFMRDAKPEEIHEMASGIVEKWKAEQETK